MKVPCPGWIKFICDYHNGTFSWMKDFKPLEDQNKNDLWIKDARKEDEGVYTCVCTWMHNQTVYRSSGSRELIKEEQRVHHKPKILVPETSEVLADKGLEKKLNCSVFCGVNVLGQCNARWEVTGRSIQTDGYSQSIDNVMYNSSKVTTSTAVLTIEKVSERDFQTTFTCIGMGLFETESRNITLRQRGIYFSFDVPNVSILLSCLLVAVLLKCFFIDIVLLTPPVFTIAVTDGVEQDPNAGQDTVVKWSNSFIYLGGGAHEEHKGSPPGLHNTRAETTAILHIPADRSPRYNHLQPPQDHRRLPTTVNPPTPAVPLDSRELGSPVRHARWPSKRHEDPERAQRHGRLKQPPWTAGNSTHDKEDQLTPTQDEQNTLALTGRRNLLK
ncbi:hypothetical protein D4764_0220320, partial [Takifugu flavidus]